MAAIKPGDRVRNVPYGEVYGRVNKVTKAGWVHVTLEGRYPVLARWPLRQVELVQEENASGDCRRFVRSARDFVFPERQAYPIPTPRCARYALTMVTWPYNEQDAVEVAEAVLARWGHVAEIREQAERVLARSLPALAANRAGDRFRVGERGPLMEDLGHGRARRVGTRKQFDVRRAGGIEATARSHGPAQYQGHEITSPTKRYYVWVLDSRDQPLANEPKGPMTLEGAQANARIGADHGTHKRAVTHGIDPSSATFEVVRVYPAGGRA